MKPVDLTVGASIAGGVLSHLASRAEMITFMRGSVAHTEAVANEAWLLTDEDVVLERRHVALTDAAQQHVLQWATDAGLLVEAHSHGSLGGPAMLSDTDLDGLVAWVPHLMWRLPGLTYIALVLGADTFDGIAWIAGAGPFAVGRIRFQGEGEWHATGRSIGRWEQRNGGS